MQSDDIKYPDAFLERMERLLGHSDFESFLASLSIPSPVSLRLSPFKKNSCFDEAARVPWCANGRYLKVRPSFTFDPLFHAGTYYVQEASSMFIEQVWRHINPDNRTVKVLDLCAAPGGKSTHLLSLMNADSLLVSNDIIPNRNLILQQNIIKWGTANCIVTRNKSVDFSLIENYFDVALVDAPCSGEGLFRKDSNAVKEWSEPNVALCAIRQKEILKHAIECLKPGGHLIYSTCTFEPSENDEQIADSGLEVVRIDASKLGAVETKYGLQFYPHKIEGEGFYIALLKKNMNNTADQFNVSHRSVASKSSEVFKKYLQSPQRFVEHQRNELLFALPECMVEDFRFLEKKLYLRNAGLFMGTLKGSDFLPSHDLALSVAVRTDLTGIELNEEEAIAYLRCETPKVKTDFRGWCLARYKTQNLGWMKVMDNRINNYFPKEWRILKQK